jgi:hypothetical protein
MNHEIEWTHQNGNSKVITRPSGNTYIGKEANDLMFEVHARLRNCEFIEKEFDNYLIGELIKRKEWFRDFNAFNSANFIEINSEDTCDYCAKKTNEEYNSACDECDQYENFSGIIAYQKVNPDGARSSEGNFLQHTTAKGTALETPPV